MEFYTPLTQIIAGVFHFVNTLLHLDSIKISFLKCFPYKVEGEYDMIGKVQNKASENMMSEEIRRRHFAEWLNQQLLERGWTQGKLISQSGTTHEDRLGSATVSRYSTGKMLPDAASCQKIARAFNLPVELVMRKAGLIDPLLDEDWVQKAADDLARAVEVGQLSEEARLTLITQLDRERSRVRVEDIVKQLANSFTFVGEDVVLEKEAFLRDMADIMRHVDVLVKDTDGNYYALEAKEVNLAGRERNPNIPTSQAITDVFINALRKNVSRQQKRSSEDGNIETTES